MDSNKILRNEALDNFIKLFDSSEQILVQILTSNNILKIMIESNEPVSPILNNSFYIEKLVCMLHFGKNEVNFFLFEKC